ncbi:MAG: hypothetical protein CVU47_08970 [Chloroflexi bacterium HGW-Chloroflexi-9]|nr:MAG: hypothetical protein CVU47_08970 [Chloroflexi bacterium HGW-Chloroflexi-9]
MIQNHAAARGRGTHKEPFVTLIRNIAGVAALLAGLVLMLGGGSGSTASAQTNNPMQLYGVTGLGAIVAGDTVTAHIGGQLLGTSVATAGGWVIEAQTGTNGATVTFKVNNRTAIETVTYRGFSAAEVTLTLPPLLPTPTPTPSATPAPSGPGTFASPPSFGSGNAGSAVFQGGSVEQLVTAVSEAGGTTVWVQDANGVWRSYRLGASGAGAFVNNGFNTAFSGGLGTTAVVVLR